MPDQTQISVIIPALNEAESIAEAVASADGADEVIVVDGGSHDATREYAAHAGARVISSDRGRARQMNAGADAAAGRLMVFMHADTRLPGGFREQLLNVIRRDEAHWGRFDLRFDAGGPLVRLIAGLINKRSRITGGATGDQAIFVTADVFRELGGYRDIPLFEDVELCRRLKRRYRMGIPSSPVVTSSRRWRTDGAIRVSLQMWSLKLMYLAGVSPQRLAKLYRDVR